MVDSIRLDKGQWYWFPGIGPRLVTGDVTKHGTLPVQTMTGVNEWVATQPCRRLPLVERKSRMDSLLSRVTLDAGVIDAYWQDDVYTEE